MTGTRRTWASGGLADAAVVFGGDAISKGLAFVASVVVMKLAHPEEMGAFVLFLAIQNVLFQATDLGLNVSLASLIASHQADRSRALSFVKAGLMIRLALLSGIVTPILLAAPWFFRSIVHAPHYILPFRYACISAYGTGLLSFATAYYQGFQRFRSFSSLRLAEGALRIGAILILVGLAGFRLGKVMAAYALAPLAVGLFGLLDPARTIRAAGWSRRELATLLHFSKWMVLSSLANGLALQMDVLLLGSMSTPAVLGEYGAALRMAVPYQIAANALFIVLLPRARSMTTPAEIRSFFARAMRYTVPAALILGIGGIAASPLIFHFFPQYQVASGLFRILAVGMSAGLALTPAGLILFALGRIDIFTWVNVAQLAFSLLANVLVIPRFGATGVAFDTAILWIGVGVANLWIARRILGRPAAMSPAASVARR